MRTIKMLGFETTSNELITDNFELVADYGDTILYQSKETFDSEDDDFKFFYKLAIRAEFVDDDLWYYELMLVPRFEDLCKEKQQSILEFVGVELQDITLDDIIAYGAYLNLGLTTSKGENYDSTILDDIAVVSTPINRMRGFYIDKKVNMIGSSGWDVLDDLLHNVDMFPKMLG